MQTERESDEVSLENALLLLSDARGIYIPRDFAEGFNMEDWHVSAEDAAILLAGPDHEWYWEAWESVLNNATLTTKTATKHYAPGTVFTLYQDGDLWAIPTNKGE